MLHEDLPYEKAEAHSTHAIPQLWELYFNGASEQASKEFQLPEGGLNDILVRLHHSKDIFLDQGCIKNVAE